MKDLKEQLIRLGHQNPSLRKHLKPVLDVVSGSKQSSRSKMSRQIGDLNEGDFFWDMMGVKWEIIDKDRRRNQIKARSEDGKTSRFDFDFIPDDYDSDISRFV